MSVVSTRAAINALLGRLEAVRAACNSAMGVSAIFGREHVALLRASLAEDEDDQDRIEAEVREAERLVGATLPILSPTFLQALVPTDVVARNIRQEFQNVARLSRTNVKIDANRAEPSTDGWSPWELAVLASALRRRIETLSHALRDINTNAKYLARAEVFVVSRATLFEPGGNRRVRIMGHDYLDPKIGAPLAAELLGHLDTIRTVSNPLPGEPETLHHFGSHSSNRIRSELPDFADPALAEMEGEPD